MLCWVGVGAGGLQKWYSQEVVGPRPGSAGGCGVTVDLLDVSVGEATETVYADGLVWGVRQRVKEMWGSLAQSAIMR